LAAGVRATVDGLSYWFHDLCSCLQDCFGTLLLHRGLDPVTVLGAGWSFFHAADQVRDEEYYYPAARDTLGADLAPFHPVRAVWRQPADEESGWADVRAAILDNRPAIVATDNFYMPNRPAFGDVHAAHLVVVWGFDDEAGEVYILESTPPAYTGPVPLADFLDARGSANRSRPGTRDYFFSGLRIDHRWIDVHLDGQGPEPTVEWLAHVLSTNVAEFLEPAGRAAGGLAGLTRWLDDTLERIAGDSPAPALGELYRVGWAAQSAAALHADFLRLLGNRFDRDAVVHAGRMVDRIASDWTAIRVLGAHGSTGGERFLGELRSRARRLVGDHEQALERLAACIPQLDRAAAAPAPIPVPTGPDRRS
jgi:hypothetical protein